jgi:GTP-binding protein Era
MNRYLGQKVAIVTRKPQTTRHKALGILTGPKGQIVFWDTPGIHESAKALNQGMLASAHSAMANSDVCLWLVDGLVWGLEHDKALETVKSRKGLPLVAAINKADLLEPVAIEKAIEEIRESSGAQIALAVSAKTGYGLKRLKRALVSLLPLSGPLFDEDALTDQTMRSIAAEYVREAIFERTRQEIPYSSAVTIDEFLEPAPLDNKPIFRISATIHVERDSQKKVMIGEKGQALKAIGQAARVGLERFLGAKDFLSLFVRVTDNWSDDERALADFGYLDPKGKG